MQILNPRLQLGIEMHSLGYLVLKVHNGSSNSFIIGVCVLGIHTFLSFQLFHQRALIINGGSNLRGLMFLSAKLQTHISISVVLSEINEWTGIVARETDQEIVCQEILIQASKVSEG